MAERGKIRNESYYSQLHDLTGLRWGKITPTDLDGFIDFGNKAFVFIEIKHVTAGLIGGQRLALERLCDATQASGKNSIVVVANHSTPPGEQIPVAVLPVTELRFNKQWRAPSREMNVRELIDMFRDWFV